jgi:hypothetical protein
MLIFSIIAVKNNILYVFIILKNKKHKKNTALAVILNFLTLNNTVNLKKIYLILL